MQARELVVEEGHLGSATFSADTLHRYDLTRTIGRPRHMGFGTCAFIGLNPSTADADKNDPTVTRCLGTAARLGYERMVMLNLFAFRSGDPKFLWKADDPVGPDNDSMILAWAWRSQLIVACWGAFPKAKWREAQVRRLLRDFPMHALAFTKDGHPRHPLYLPNGLDPVIYKEKGEL